MTRKPKTTEFWCSRLPHWEVEEGRYFITVHLAGAIPVSGRDQLRAIGEELRNVSQHDSPDWLKLQRAIFREMELWLDRSEWSTHLARSDIAEMVMASIEHRSLHGNWNMFEYVVMPTHIHLFCEFGSHGMKQTMDEFKRWTGHQAAKMLGSIEGHFWQREWFDHWSRSDEEDLKIAQYIRKNPEKAKLVEHYEDWPYRSK